MKPLSLWRFHAVVGEWRLAREVYPETAMAWLARFQKDEPSVVFALSASKPKQRSRGAYYREAEAKADADVLNAKAAKADAERIKRDTNEMLDRWDSEDAAMGRGGIT